MFKQTKIFILGMAMVSIMILSSCGENTNQNLSTQNGVTQSGTTQKVTTIPASDVKGVIPGKWNVGKSGTAYTEFRADGTMYPGDGKWEVIDGNKIKLIASVATTIFNLEKIGGELVLTAENDKSIKFYKREQ